MDLIEKLMWVCNTGYDQTLVKITEHYSDIKYPVNANIDSLGPHATNHSSRLQGLRYTEAPPGFSCNTYIIVSRSLVYGYFTNNLMLHLGRFSS